MKKKALLRGVSCVLMKVAIDRMPVYEFRFTENGGCLRLAVEPNDCRQLNTFFTRFQEYLLYQISEMEFEFVDKDTNQRREIQAQQEV